MRSSCVRAWASSSASTSSSTSLPTRASATAKPRCRRLLSTAWPWGSRMPGLGRTSTVAFTRAPPPAARGSPRTPRWPGARMPRRRPLRDGAVERQREPLDLVVALVPDQLGARGAVDVLVVSGLRLRRRGEDRLGQLLRLAQALWESMAADLAGREIVLPPGPREVTAH